MGLEVKTRHPKKSSEPLGDFIQGDVFYLPYARENWLLASIIWHNNDTSVSCEVIAEGQAFHGPGSTLRLKRYRHVYRCNEMEALAWASL